MGSSFLRCRPNLAKLVQDTFAEIGPTRRQLGRSGTSLARVRPKLAKSWQNLSEMGPRSVQFGRSHTKVGRDRATLAAVGQISAELDQIWGDVDQFRQNVGQMWIWPNLVQLGQISAKFSRTLVLSCPKLPVEAQQSEYCVISTGRISSRPRLRHHDNAFKATRYSCANLDQRLLALSDAWQRVLRGSLATTPQRIPWSTPCVFNRAAVVGAFSTEPESSRPTRTLAHRPAQARSPPTNALGVTPKQPATTATGPHPLKRWREKQATTNGVGPPSTVPRCSPTLRQGLSRPMPPSPSASTVVAGPSPSRSGSRGCCHAVLHGSVLDPPASLACSSLQTRTQSGREAAVSSKVDAAAHHEAEELSADRLAPGAWETPPGSG